MASTPQARTKSPTIKRILREAAELTATPSPDYTAEPLETDLFEWHFTMRGPPNSPYSDGMYHGRIILPATYPLRPPSFRFTTPNGRFEANREICLSISGHHEETWQPAWGIRTAIVALRSFMETDAHGQLGGYDTTEAVRRRLAAESQSFRCPSCGKTNSDIIKECEQRAKEADTGNEDVEIPKELNMEFKDQIGSSSKKDKAEDGEETAEIAEGFVQTTPTPPQGDGAADGARLRTQAGPAQSVPQPTPTVPLQGMGTPERAPAIVRNQPATNGVPVWIDRLIVGLVVLLAALILKVLMGI